MAANLYNQYAWLVDTIRTAGRITKHEIDERWARSPLNDKHESVYPLRSFHRHKEAIADIFGLYIGCDKLDGNRYYISDRVGNMNSDFRTKLCNTLTFANLLLDSHDMQKRVIWEPFNDGSPFLATLLDAMRNRKMVALHMKAEIGGRVRNVLPYCIGQRNRLWYLAAKDEASAQEVDVIPLTDIDSINILPAKGVMPRWFKGDIFFASFFDKTTSKEKSKKVAKEEKHDKAPQKKAEKKGSKEKDVLQDNTPQLSLF